MQTTDISVRTEARYEFVSITEEVEKAVRESGVDEGVCVVSSAHTTAGVTVNEDYDRDVPRDLAAACRASSALWALPSSTPRGTATRTS
jgi:secondary thiamine-phosphate synthase enzyme